MDRRWSVFGRWPDERCAEHQHRRLPRCRNAIRSEASLPVGVEIRRAVPPHQTRVQRQGQERGNAPKEILDRYRAAYSSFNPEVVPNLDEFLYEPFYQIMRQRLLADRMVHQRELDVAEAKVVVVVPDRNRAYRRVTDGGKTTSPPLIRRFPRLETVDEVMRVALKDAGPQFDMVAPSPCSTP